MTATAIQTAVQDLARVATIGFLYGGLDKGQAAKLVCQNAIDESKSAMQRTGVWNAESTTEQIEAVLFLGSVAADALADRQRPSVGNVMDAIVAKID